MSQQDKMHGTRYLEKSSDVFEHNAWDDVEWSEELQREAAAKVAKNSQSQLNEEEQRGYEQDADKMWDKFYGIHQNRFFKDRQWLFKEFPELIGGDMAAACEKENGGGAAAVTSVTSTAGEASCEEGTAAAQACCSSSDARTPAQLACGSRHRILEVGCGVGNTVFPLLRSNNDPHLFVYCCDFSSTAIDIVKAQEEYDSSRCHAFVCDVADEGSQYPMEDGSLDVVTLIFVLSALQPCKMASAIQRLSKLLKPGGLLLFRDYGHHDLAQLRFKPGHCLGENFYVRGDGTRCYFFKQEELHELFVGAGLERVQNVVDRRLQVNRGRQLTMYRVWIQCKYQKSTPSAADPPAANRPTAAPTVAAEEAAH